MPIDFSFELEGWLPMEPEMGPPLPRLLGIYWPWYEAPAAEFDVSDLTISPAEVAVGQVVAIHCTVKNAGTETGSYTVQLGGDFMAQQTVTLGPGESKTISFSVTPTVAKSYTVSVDGLYGNFVATQAPVTDIRVENLTISPSEVMVGETVSISVTATNYGNASGTKTITCTVT